MLERIARLIQIRLLSVLALIALAAACGGGGGGGTATVPSAGGGGTTTVTVTPTPAAGPPAGQAAVRFSISVPKTGTSSVTRRSPKFVDPNTQSLTLTLIQANGQSVNGSVQGPFNLVSGAPGCTSTGTLTCTFSINAPITSTGQTDVFLANTFSSPNAVGPLGSGAVSLSVVQNTVNTANLTLSGPVASVTTVSNNSANFDTLWDGLNFFLPLPASLLNNNNQAAKARTRGAAARHPLVLASAAPTPIPSERIFIIATDALGNVILNPTQYNQPIQLTLGLNFGTANVTLSDTPPSGLTCPGSGTSTSTDQGSVLVCSPSDVVTLSIIPTIPSQSVFMDNQFFCCFNFNINFPTLTATLPFSVEVNPTPGPSSTPSGPVGGIQVIGS
jgi:hypothetical protein